MRKRIAAATLVVLTLVSFRSVSVAHADVTPPQNPPGASIATGKYQTKVAMVSENVLMTIDDYTPPFQSQDQLLPFMRGQVDATFTMQNQGTAAESFDVWFPLSSFNEDGAFPLFSTIDDFDAWVDGVPATGYGHQETNGKFDYKIPWVTWPVTFPPGKTITLRLTYDTYGVGQTPYSTFGYILHTGAGWNGPIGEGTVTFRLPYQVNNQNAALTQGDPQFLPTGGPFSVHGTDVVWHFTNLEPTEDNDISLVVMSRTTWTQITAAENVAAANPTSEYAQLALAKTMQVLRNYHGVVEGVGDVAPLFEAAASAYDRALRMDPNNVQIMADYLTWLDSRALQLDPNNPTLIDLRNSATQIYRPVTQSPGDRATDAALAVEEATRSVGVIPTIHADATNAEAIRLGLIPPPPTDTPPPMITFDTSPPPTPTEEYPHITLGPSPTTSPTPTPIPADRGATGQDWTGMVVVALVVLIVAAAWLGRRSQVG